MFYACAVRFDVTENVVYSCACRYNRNGKQNHNMIFFCKPQIVKRSYKLLCQVTLFVKKNANLFFRNPII